MADWLSRIINSFSDTSDAIEEMKKKAKISHRVITEVTLPSGKRVGVSINQKGIALTQRYDYSILGHKRDLKLRQEWTWDHVQRGFDEQKEHMDKAVEEEEAKAQERQKKNLEEAEKNVK